MRYPKPSGNQKTPTQVLCKWSLFGTSRPPNVTSLSYVHYIHVFSCASRICDFILRSSYQFMDIYFSAFFHSYNPLSIIFFNILCGCDRPATESVQRSYIRFPNFKGMFLTKLILFQLFNGLTNSSVTSGI